MRLKTLAFITVLAVGMSARATNVPRIILDSDVSGDYDDIGAMATLFNLEAEGKCRVLGIASSSAYPWSVPLVETIARSFGRGDLPIARSVPGAPEAKNWEKVQFAQVVSARFAHPRFAETKDAAEPVRFYRDLLSAQPDGSVTLCVVGWASNVAALLESEGGRELVARKVAKLVWMAGREKGGRECNFMMDVKASKRVLADFPRPIVLSTFEIGSHVFTGCRLVKELGVDDPVRLCYSTVFAQSPATAKRGRESWDQTAVWYAVHGDDELFRTVRGTIAATDDKGTNSWADDPNGPHARLDFAVPPEQVAARIEDYMVKRPARYTSSPDPRPYIWWHWTGTAVTKEGIVRDLDSMLEAGIGGATIFQVARGPCSEVLAEGYEDDTIPDFVFGNDAWCDMVAFAAHEAKVRGLEIGMHNCPGYTVSGGPWITPELAMKKLVWTSAPTGTEPSQPETNLGFYREIGTVDVGDRTYRFGYTCTGSQCMPVAKALWNRCLEADKMSAKAVNLHLDNVLRRPLGLDFILMDSYEAGPYDWTDDFRAEFEKRRGYDPLPRLPAYVGAVSDGAEKIKADMARTVKELSTERHYWIFRDRLHAAGLKFIVEPYGGPFDASEAAWASDMPTTEFWGRRPFWVKEGEIGAHPQVGGAAGRAAGRTILAAEAFTAMPFDDSYTVAPRDLKACADASFARGINRMLLHHWVHQPFPACRKPGNGMGYWGTHFGENQTWYEPGKAFFRYLRNCQEWLQRGEQVIDVLAVGEGFGNCDDVDVVPRRIYETDTETKDGRVRIVSSGRTYSQVCLNPQNLKIPRRPFEVVGGMPVTPDGPVLGTARVDKDGTRFFFVANVSTNHVVFTADFRATGVPELHDLEGGRTGRKDVLSVKDGYSRLRLSLEAQESVVVVFRPDSSLPPWEDRSVAGWTAQTLAAPWSVAFEPDRGAPTEPIELKELRSLSAHSDARIRFFSGTATYRTRFTAKASGKCEIDLGDVRDIARVRLNGKDLGVAWHFPFRVSADGALKAGENVLEVEVTNGWHNRLLGDKAFTDDCEWGPLRKHQCAMDGSKGVCGRGLKRIPGWAWNADGSRPSTNRVAFTTWDYFAEGGELVTSGLIGPVRILTPDVRTGKKVLMIGNSFSQSVLTRLPAVAAADGEDLDISNLMIGGCVLSRHASNIVAYAKDPTFKPYTWPRYRNGKFVGRTKTNIPEALAADKWDIVTIQQGSSACYQADSYHPWGDELVATIRKYAPQAKIMVQQTWSYNELNRCIHDPYTGGPGWFGIDRDTMYRNLTSNYYAFAEKYGFEVIPTGNAVELFRHRLDSSDPSEDVVGRFPQPKTGWFDLIHLNDRGCDLQAYVWYKALFGKDPRELPNAKDGRDRLLRDVANDVFSVPPLSIEPYPARAGDYTWQDVFVGTPADLVTLTDMPDTFRLDVAASVPSGSVEISYGTVRFALAADGTATATWNPLSGPAETKTWPGAAKDPGAAVLRVLRTNGGTSLWHFYVDGVEIGRADTRPAGKDASGAYPKPSVAAREGASVGRVVIAKTPGELPGYEKVESSKLVCNAPAGWDFSFRKERETEPGVEVWRLVATSPTNATLPKFEVRFTHAADDVRHCWHAGNPFWSGYQSDWRLNPVWGGGYRTGFDWNSGVNVALGDDECSRLTAITSEAVETVGVTFGYSETEDSLLHARYAFGTQATDPCTNYCVRFRLDSRKVPLWQSVTEAMRWQRLAAGLDVTPAPEIAYDPVYSTWYAYQQDVDANVVLREAKAGAAMGLKNMFVDDGWNCETKGGERPGYTICGDWEVCTRKFPDMAKHVRAVHDAGMKYVMWYALPQVGVKSKAHERFKGKYLIESPTHAILDPRYPEVRAFMADFCVKAMDEWDVDGFKLDFIDTIRIWGSNGDLAAKNGFTGCDTRSLMKAIDIFLKDLQTRLRQRRRDTLIEFRQPYDGQAIRQYCNMMRVCDCPCDVCANRVNIAKLRLVCEDTAVHSDMLTWGKGVAAEDAALQILNSLFAVVQYSKPLARGLPEAERRMLAHWIRFTQEHRDALLRGAFRPHHAEQNFPVIEGENGLERIVGVYAANVPAPCVPDRDVYLVNATGADEILVESDAAATAELFDVFGEPAGTAKIAKGLQRLAVPRSGYARVASVRDDVVLRAGQATMRLSGTSGAILSLKDADGVELLERADELFTLQLLDDGGNERRLRSSDFRLDVRDDALVFTREQGPRVVMKVGTSDGRFDFTPTVSCIPPGHLLEWFDGPQPYVASSGGRLYWPFYDGCEVTDLEQRESGTWIDYRPLGYTPRCKAWGALYPGNCQMQFMAFYRDGRGVYFGCHDPTHTQMGVEYDWRGKRATRLSLQMFCGEAKDGVWTAPAPFTLRLYEGGWMEACEIYRDFIHTLPEFQTPVKRPKWMYDSPVNLIYPVQGEGIDHGPDPMKTNRYYPFVNVMPEVEKYGRLFDSKIMALIMHWEGTAPWCPPYVWPPLGGEEGLAKLRDALHVRGDLLGLYCSGCAWTQVSCINGYSQERKCREEGLERWMMRGPKGQLEATICNHRFAQRFGYDMCLTEKWSQDTLVEEIGKIARFGVDYCQYFDQNIGGAALLCYSRAHHHPPVPGAWQTKAMLDLQDKVFAKIDEVGSQMTLGCEACAATPFVKNLFYNDSRANNDVSYGNPVAGLPFVFHEWMSNFSGNQIGHDADVGYRWMRSFHYGESFSVVLGADGKLQNAWGIPWDRPRPDQDRLIALVKNLNAVRKANLPWLLEGRMLKPFAKVESKETLVKYGQYDVRTTEVMSSFWEAPDGRRRAFLSNWGLKDASATVTFADGVRKVYTLKSGEIVWFDGK